MAGFDSIWGRIVEAGLKSEARRVDEDAARRLMDWIHALFPDWGDLTDPRLGATSIEREPAESEAVRQFLRDQGIPGDERIYVHWWADRAGVELPYEAFVQHYDDLWFPGAHDVSVVSLQSRRIVEISHEEFVLGADLPDPPADLAPL